jgi:hypothetical protein
MFYTQLSTNGIKEEFYSGSLKKTRAEINTILSTYTLSYQESTLWKHRTFQDKMRGKTYNDSLNFQIENTKIRISKIRKI